MKAVILGVAMVMVVFMCSHAMAQVEVAEFEESGKTSIRLKNEWVSFDLRPWQGARISRFTSGLWEDGKDIVMINENERRIQGLLLDHFKEQSWPGELMVTNYEYKIESRGPQEGVVLCSVRSAGGGQKELADILLEKRIILRSKSPVVAVSFKFSNPGAGTKRFGFWAQQIYWLAGDKENDVYYYPSGRGVREWIPPSSGEGIFSDVVAGWIGTVDRRTQAGLVWTFDYAWLEQLYSSLGAYTQEWKYDSVMIPSGAEWETTVYCAPTKGMKRFDYATPDFAIAVDPMDPLAQAISGAIYPWAVKGKTKITVSRWNSQMGRDDVLGEGEVNVEPFAVNSFDAKLAKALGESGVLRIKLDFPLITGASRSETFYTIVGNSQTGAPPSTVHITAPVRQRVFPKPKQLVKIKDDQFDVLFVKGLYHDLFGITPALNEFSKVRVQEAEVGRNFRTSTTTNFTDDYEAMMKTDVVVLANVDAACLGAVRIEMLKEFVSSGGGLLVCGGICSFGYGGYANTQFQEVLPVVGDQPFDLCSVAGDCRIHQVDADDSLMKGFENKSWPWCYYIHKQRCRDGAHVVLKCGDHPLLVTWNYGKGRVAVFLGSPHGHVRKDELPFWQWDDWPKVMACVLGWLGRK